MSKYPKWPDIECDGCKMTVHISKMGGLGYCNKCWDVVKSFRIRVLKEYIKYKIKKEKI